MTITKEEYVGIDVARDQLDVAVLGIKTARQASNSQR